MSVKSKNRVVWPLLLLAVLSLLVVAHQKSLSHVEENVSYGVAQGEPLLLDVVRLPAAGLRPAIIFVHGGGWRGGDKSDFRALAEGFAQRGYVCFVVNYRLVNATDHHFPAQLDDVQHAVRWIRANAARYGVDPNRIGAMGASAGGHLVALLGTAETRDQQPPELAQYSSRVQCVVDMYGPTDLTALPATPADVPKLVHNLMGGTPEQEIQLYRSASPIFNIDRETVPFLIFHGALDPLVPVEQSRRFVTELQKNGVPATYIEFPDEGHGIEKHANLEKFVTMSSQFFDSHLKR